MNNLKLTYRADIDGLRAIAVLAVIANHLPAHLLASGFLGVDVFFVISGFVVSASLLGQRTATFSVFYSSFLSRRVKRLMPALITCVAITGAIVFWADPFPRNSILTGISALFGVANITLFNFELDYFSPSSKFNAFTHTWSLGVEEQFYIAFPLIIWLTYIGREPRRVKILGIAIALFSVVSLFFFLRLYSDYQAAAFYLMPMRFWELGAGVLIYLSSITLFSIQLGRVLAFSSPIVLAALLLCFMVPMDYASWSTPVAVGLTALLLLDSGRHFSGRVLSLPPVVYIGKISYSLYLWHWPVIALGPLVLSVSWQISILYAVTMSVAAILSYHLIERPLRLANWSKSKVQDIAMAFACSFLLGVAAYLLLHIERHSIEQGGIVLHPAAFLPLLDSRLPYDTCWVDEQRPMTPTTFDQCTIPPAPGSEMPMIWAMGDSHVGHLQAMLYELHQQKGFGVHLIATPGHLFPYSSEGEYPPRQKIFREVLERLKPGDIVLISRYYLTRTPLTRRDHQEPHPDMPSWVESVSSLAKELKARGVTLIIAGPPPSFKFTDVRECDIAQRRNCAIVRAEIAAAIDPVMKQLYAVQSQNKNLHVFDIFAQVCRPDAEFCYPDDGSSFLLFDWNHFNSLGSKRLAEPFINFLQSSGVLRR